MELRFNSCNQVVFDLILDKEHPRKRVPVVVCSVLSSLVNRDLARLRPAIRPVRPHAGHS